MATSGAYPVFQTTTIHTWASPPISNNVLHTHSSPPTAEAFQVAQDTHTNDDKVATLAVFTQV